MYFANPLGLIGLLSLPVIAVIHLYHRRLPPMSVAGLHLWGGEIRQPTPGRKRERLPVTLSLFLELLAALLLSLVLSQPRFGEIDSVQHIVAVLDGSASMSAVDSDGVSFRDRAFNEIARRVEAAPRGSVVTVIATGRRPVLLAGPGVHWSDAEKTLASWQPSATKHDFSTALDMATQLASTTGNVLFLTDDLPAENARLPDTVDVVSVGQPLGNVAIVAARWGLDSRTLTGTVFVRLANRGARAVESRVLGTAGEKKVFEATVTLAPDGEKVFETEVPGGLGRIVLTVETANDPLAIDNSVTLIEPQTRSVAVANRLPEDAVARGAIQRVLKTIPDVRSVEPDQAHLLFDRASELPPSQRNLWWFGVGPIDTGDAARKAARDLLGPYLIDKRHPLSDGILLSGVVWSGVQPLSLEMTPIISAGNLMLLSRLNGTQTTAYLLNLDLAKSNIAESPDWPILLSNLVEQRRDNLPGLRRWNYRLNEDVTFRLFEGVESDSVAERELKLEHNGTSKKLARTPIVELPPLVEAGIYTVRDGENEFAQFAVNFFDLEESTLKNLRPGSRESAVESSSGGYELDTTLTVLLMVGIVLIIGLAFGDWFVLRPKHAVL